MNTHRIVTLGWILAFLLTSTLGTAWADRGRRFDDRRPSIRHVEKGYVLDKRHRHNRYYPRPGHVVKTLPRGHRSVVHHRTKYYTHNGIWYRPSGLHFSVIAPPVGLIVPILPHFYTTIWVGAVPYYYASGTYYTWHPEHRGYMVIAPPNDDEVYEEPEIPEQLFIYPKMGQSEEMQATDRYECHRWAVGQSGFDPTQPGGNVPADENAARRTDYNRATKACLDARDYSVQ